MSDSVHGERDSWFFCWKKDEKGLKGGTYLSILGCFEREKQKIF